MDGTRKRRTRDQARRAWYSRHRQLRFSRWLGFSHVGDRDDGRPRRVADSLSVFPLAFHRRDGRPAQHVLASTG